MQIPILGLLMAALIAIPILVAILYRFSSSLPFIAVVGFLAVMPWLAITLLVSCVVASIRPFRTQLRFMSALLGLIPAVVYLVLAWSGTSDVIVGKIDPVDRIKFVAPWVLAIVAAAVVFAIVLAIAKLVDYRPGAIAPLLAVMFGVPVALFEYNVGRDELYYRLLERHDEDTFADKDASLGLEQAVYESWLHRPPPRPSMDAVRATVATRWLFELASDVAPVESALDQHRAGLVARADWFVTHFPQSRYTANALFIKARAQDMRVDPAEFRRSKWIRFYDDFPSPASRETWRVVAANRPDSILGTVAYLRLAQLDAREGNVDRAIGKLEQLLERFDIDAGGADDSAAPVGPLTGVLARRIPEASLRLSLDRILIEARRLHGLLVENRDPLYGQEPICGSRRRTVEFPFGLLDLDPRHDWYVRNLNALLVQYPNCQIADNIQLELAKAAADIPRRIELLENCLDKYGRGDAVPEALFRLGVAYKAAGESSSSDSAFTRLFLEHPESVWSKQAARYSPQASQTRVSRTVR